MRLINDKKQTWIYLLIMVIAILMRTLQTYHYWIDEFTVFSYIKHYAEDGLFNYLTQTSGREFMGTFLPYIMGLTEPEQIRVFYMAVSLFSIALIPLVVDRDSLIIMGIVAVAPFFVYWSHFCRPYTLMVFFVILAWRYPLFMVLAVLTNPMAIIGCNLTKRKWWLFYIMLGGVAYYLYSIQPWGGWNYQNHLSLDFLSNARRIYAVPFIVILLYISTIPNSWAQRVQLSAKRLVGNA